MKAEASIVRVTTTITTCGPKIILYTASSIATERAELETVFAKGQYTAVRIINHTTATRFYFTAVLKLQNVAQPRIQREPAHWRYAYAQ